MERTLKSKDASETLLLPCGEGWLVSRSGGQLESYADLELAAPSLDPQRRLHLILPLRAVLLHRMELPSIEEHELRAMTQLQLEKTLPFSSEEITCNILVVNRREKESTVLAISAGNQQLDSLCKPLMEKGILPAKVTLFVEHVAQSFPQAESALIVFREQQDLIFVFSQAGCLNYAQMAPADSDNLPSQLPAMLLGAELEGVRTDFSHLFIEEGCSRFATALGLHFGMPTTTFKLEARAIDSACELVPAEWNKKRETASRSIVIRTRLKQVAFAYLLLLVLGAGAVFWLQYRLSKLSKKLVSAQPQMEFVAEAKGRWAALAPAIDPSRYAVEVLFQLYNSLPSPEVHLTKFTQTPSQFMVEGEAPTANLAIEFGEKIKQNPALGQYSFEIAPPAILPNERAQFRIFGKL